MKRLAVFLDGTWNDPTDNTNVWRLHTLVADRDANGIEQRSYYDTGVGVKWHERLRGGVGGYGLSKNVQQAYRWLVENHDEGDEIFVFGFSRGAFTARSLTGLIATCGLLHPGAAMTDEELYDRYRQREDAIPLYRLERRNIDDLEPDDAWLVRNSRRVPIEFTGIWDTVGTLGIPFGGVPGLSRRRLRFHSTRLSTIFQKGCHAVALDEHRKPYDATLWTNYVPLKPATGEIVEERLAREYYPGFEQRWFVGAHRNVGGGLERNVLAEVPLHWIQSRAAAAGLAFRATIQLRGDEHLEGEVVDSFGRFLKGLYRAVRLGRRHHRAVGRAPHSVTGGLVESVNESIDRTVVERWQRDATYRPTNLAQWAEGAGVDLDSASTTSALRIRTRVPEEAASS